MASAHSQKQQGDQGVVCCADQAVVRHADESDSQTEQVLRETTGEATGEGVGR
jgi:hypothetical protein